MPGMPEFNEMNSCVSDIFCHVMKTLLMEQYLFVIHTAGKHCEQAVGGSDHSPGYFWTKKACLTRKSAVAFLS